MSSLSPSGIAAWISLQHSLEALDGSLRRRMRDLGRRAEKEHDHGVVTASEPTQHGQLGVAKSRNETVSLRGLLPWQRPRGLFGSRVEPVLHLLLHLCKPRVTLVPRLRPLLLVQGPPNLGLQQAHAVEMDGDLLPLGQGPGLDAIVGDVLVIDIGEEANIHKVVGLGKRIGTSGVSDCDIFMSSSSFLLIARLPSSLVCVVLVTAASSSTDSSFVVSPFTWSSFVYASVIGRGY